jgi:hypothetical protein
MRGIGNPLISEMAAKLHAKDTGVIELYCDKSVGWVERRREAPERYPSPHAPVLVMIGYRFVQPV